MAMRKVERLLRHLTEMYQKLPADEQKKISFKDYAVNQMITFTDSQFDRIVNDPNIK